MPRTSSIAVLAVVAVIAASCMPGPRTDRRTSKLLDELDGYLATRELYVAKKKDQLDAYRRLIDATQDPASRYELEMIAAADYFAFSFDSTQTYLKMHRRWHCSLATGIDTIRHQSNWVTFMKRPATTWRLTRFFTFKLIPLPCRLRLKPNTSGSCMTSVKTWLAIPAW
ncbi:MAG: hypothetical protein J6X99_04410 [Bacteroidales bacterium]|nr:hypothetical protein [Bacteroidales bacterium]